MNKGHTCCCDNCKPAPTCKVKLLEKMINILLDTPDVMTKICFDNTGKAKHCLDESCKTCICKHLKQQAIEDIVKEQNRKAAESALR